MLGWCVYRILLWWWRELSECPCSRLNGLDLALCLAPPRGEYETSFKIKNNLLIIINRDGIFIRQSAIDDFLPFVTTVERRVRPEVLERYGISVERILCENVSNLVEAARKGSRVARELVVSCNELIEKIINNCSSST